MASWLQNAFKETYTYKYVRMHADIDGQTENTMPPAVYIDWKT